MNTEKKTEEDASGFSAHTSKDKPLFLLHTCCGPCATHVLDLIKDRYHPIAFFYNPNLYPENEFYERLAAAAQVSRQYHVAIWAPPYRPERWIHTVRGLEPEPEGGKRCEMCIEHRLRMTARMAEACFVQAFGTTLTVGPQKKSRKINEIGRHLSKEYNMFFLDVDFKKENGFKKSVLKSKQLGLYRQSYCGCRFSMKGRSS